MGAPPSGNLAESRRRIEALSRSLRQMKASTEDASLCCEQLTKRSRQLDSLTSPASDASGLLSRASNNLGATLVLMKDAREKFDTVVDCEPAIERLHRGILHMQSEKSGRAGGGGAGAGASAGKGARHNPFGDGRGGADRTVVLSEQDVYAAADSMEIIRDAYDYFIDRRHWRSTAAALGSLERVHQMGVSSMCILESFHLVDSGQAVRIKRVVKQEGESQVTQANETAQQVSRESRSSCRSHGTYPHGGGRHAPASSRCDPRFSHGSSFSSAVHEILGHSVAFLRACPPALLPSRRN